MGTWLKHDVITIVNAPLEKAWNFVDKNVEITGVVHESCTGTGSLENLNEYLIRKRENGFDNRGGSVAAWFMVSLYELEN